MSVFSPLIELWQNLAWFFYLSLGLLGLLVGSFLNVVIYRLPIMLKREWEADCAFMQGNALPEQEAFNLVTPASSCRECGHKIRAWENIPVISYLLQRGRCTNCGTHISAQYPLVELITAIFTLLVAFQFGVSWQVIAALFFTWLLIAASVIDLQTTLLPDRLTYLLLWAGFVVNLNGLFVDLETAVIGAMAGYLSLWSVFWLFKLLTGKDGMGYGDFKLLAALGAWLGWQALPGIILLSSVVGAAVGISLILLKKRELTQVIPFGPYLAAAGWLMLMYGDALNAMYLGLWQ